MSTCFYAGNLFEEGTTIRLNETCYDCFDSTWLAQGSICEDSAPVISPEVAPPIQDNTAREIGTLEPESDDYTIYNGLKYSKGARIVLDGQLFRASFGTWLADISI
jgi:hypothetical protein